MRSRAMVVATVLGAALVSGGWFVQRGFGGDVGGRGPVSGAKLFDQVLTHVREHYVDTLDQGALYQKAVDGVLRELNDPHSVFLHRDRLARLDETTTGRYAGVGIQMDVREGAIIVVAALPGTPAERAGIQTGDRIVMIEEKSTERWTSEEALKALRGAPGTSVKLVVERPGMEAPLPFTITRQEIQFHAVQNAFLLGDAVGYVDLTTFSQDAATDLRRAVDSLRRAGARGIVLDLRGNPGGLLEEGVAVSDLFLEPGQRIVSMKGRTPDATRDFVDRAEQPFPGLPVVVLIDSSSASASEIVAGALQDHDRAAIVGTASYGKGSAQSVFRLPEGGGLKLTTALWYTPSGRGINRPQVVAEGEDVEPSPFTIDTTKARDFRTDMGRRLTGWGGIHPDVEVAEPVLTEKEEALERALGTKLPRFRDALVAYALELKGRRAVTSPDFVVTQQMRDELHARAAERGVTVDRAVWNGAAPALDRLIGSVVTQYVFGRQAEVARSTRDDAMVLTARELLRGASGPRDVVERAVQRADSLKKARR